MWSELITYIYQSCHIYISFINFSSPCVQIASWRTPRLLHRHNIDGCWQPLSLWSYARALHRLIVDGTLRRFLFAIIYNSHAMLSNIKNLHCIPWESTIRIAWEVNFLYCISWHGYYITSHAMRSNIKSLLCIPLESTIRMACEVNLLYCLSWHVNYITSHAMRSNITSLLCIP